MKLITELLEETLYKHYSERYPVMVASIRQLLIHGEKPSAIKNRCEKTIGKCITSNNVSFVIDYINKQLKN